MGDRPRRNYYSTYVEIDIGEVLAECDSETLIEELRSRSIEVGNVDPAFMHSRMFDALVRGQKDTALELLRTYLQDITGRVLP